MDPKAPATIGIIAGLFAGVGAAVYYATRPAVASAATSTPPVTPTPPAKPPIVHPPTKPPKAPSPPTAPTYPIPSAPTSGGPTGAMTYSVTEINSGQTINMHVGDTLAVRLDMVAPIQNFEISNTGSSVAEGVYDGTSVPGQISQPWNASAVGASQISYQPLGAGNANDGSPILFNVVVS